MRGPRGARGPRGPRDGPARPRPRDERALRTDRGSALPRPPTPPSSPLHPPAGAPRALRPSPRGDGGVDARRAPFPAPTAQAPRVTPTLPQPRRRPRWGRYPEPTWPADPPARHTPTGSAHGGGRDGVGRLEPPLAGPGRAPRVPRWGRRRHTPARTGPERSPSPSRRPCGPRGERDRRGPRREPSF